MTPLFARSSLRHLARHRWLVALSVLGIALGVAVVIAIDLANESARRAFLLSTEAAAGRATHQVTAGPAGIAETAYVALRVELGAHEAAPVVEGYARSVSIRLARSTCSASILLPTAPSAVTRASSHDSISARSCWSLRGSSPPALQKPWVCTPVTVCRCPSMASRATCGSRGYLRRKTRRAHGHSKTCSSPISRPHRSSSAREVDFRASISPSRIHRPAVIGLPRSRVRFPRAPTCPRPRRAAALWTR